MEKDMLETYLLDGFMYLIYLVLCPLQHTIARGVFYVSQTPTATGGGGDKMN